MLQKPVVQLGAHRSQLGAGLGGVGRDDEEFARRVGDLAGRRQLQCLQHLERGQFGEQRHLERAPAQEPRGIAPGLAAVGKDEVLDTEKVALNEQKLLLVPVAALFQALGSGGIGLALGCMPAPQGHGQCGGGFAVVVQRYLGLAAKGRGRGNGLGKGEPGGVEMV